MNQWTNEWMYGWLDEWAASLLSYFFTWYLFSQVLLPWAASYLIWATFSDPALSCLPASSSLASAPQLFSPCSCYNAFSIPQLQSRIAVARSKTTCREAITMRLATSSGAAAAAVPIQQTMRTISRLCAFCRQLSQIEARIFGNRDPTRRQKPHCQKNTGFRARECFHPWIQTLPNFYSPLPRASKRH